MSLRAPLTVCILLFAYFLNSQSVGIYGTIFVDKNDDGFHSPGELTIGEQGKTLIIDLIREDGLLIATTTDSHGNYIFLTEPGNYFIQFMPPLSIPISSSVSNTVDDDIDGDDNGIQIDTDNDNITDGPITTGLITLSEGDEPTNESSPNWDSSMPDENLNSTIDFGLTAMLGIGGSVFIDENNNGIWDQGEESLGERGQQLQMDLFDSSGSLLQSTMTDSEGDYEFETKTGDYYISFEPPVDYPRSSSITSSEDNNVSKDDNGIQEDIDGDGLTEGLITSPIISLRTGSEPVNEPQYSSIDDENADMTIDFGLQERTSATQEISSKDINVHPNPVSEILIISSEYGISNIELRTSHGQLIGTIASPLATKEISINVSGLITGSYTAIINTVNGRSIKKFVKL